MERLGTVLLFYKPLLMWSLLLNIVLTMVSPSIFITILTKLFLFVLILYFIKKTKRNSELLLCDKSEISKLKFYTMLFTVDTLITISFLSVLSVFI